MTERTAGIATKALVAALGLLLVALALTTVVGGSLRPESAGASPTTCPTYPAAAMKHCTTTTTNPHRPSTTHPHGPCPSSSAPTLTASYANGLLTWQASGLPNSATNFAVQVYVDGQPVPGGVTTVQSGGCTSSITDPLCLAAGSHTVAVAAGPYGTPSATLNVVASGCAAAAAPTTGHSGLAFTGSKAALLLFIAALLLLVGYALTRLSRERRRRHHRSRS